MSLILPYGFRSKFCYLRYKIEYKDLCEIGQGGPEVGRLYIDDKKIDRSNFSGPSVFHENLMFVPILTRSFLQSAFKIAVINLNDRSLKLLGTPQTLILPFKFENDEIYFFTDLNNTIIKKIRLK